MEQVLTIWPYEEASGITIEWSNEARVQINSGPVPHIRANAAGLLALAQACATLAQENVPSGEHLHIDDFVGATGGEIIIERE